MTKGGIANLVRRAVLACIVGHPKVGKKTLIKKLIGQNPKEVEGPIPDKGRPDLVDHSLKWYKVEGGVYLMNEPGIIPPITDNPISCTRLAVCGDYENATVSEPLIAEHLISHLGSLRGKDPIMDRILRDTSVHPSAMPAPDFLRESVHINPSTQIMFTRVAEAKFDGSTVLAARHLLEAYRKLEYGTFALEMPYMLSGGFTLEEPLIYDKDTATGLQSGIMSQF